MSKVKKEIVEAAVLKFIAEVTKTMPNSTYKFVLGSAGALATLKGAGQVSQMLTFATTDDGMIDTAVLKQVVDAGFKASDNKLQIELFQPGSVGLLSLFVKPLTLTINRSDIDAIFAEIDQNGIQEVSLAQMQKS